MHDRKAVLAAFLVTLAPLAAFAAPLTVDKTDYRLTYGEGWAVPRFLPDRDSASIAEKTYGLEEEFTATSWTQGLTGVTDSTAATRIASITQVYRQGLVPTDTTVKTLGGKDFRSTGWRDTGDGGGGQRLRIYSYRQGSFLFLSWVVHDSPEADGAVAEVEAALASLEIKATGIPRFAWNRRDHRARARVDILGRTWRPTAGHMPMGPFYRKR